MNETEKEYITPKPQRLEDSQIKDIEDRLQDLGITPDKGFWNTSNYHGYNSVDDALTFCEATGIDNLKFLTTLIANGVPYD